MIRGVKKALAHLAWLAVALLGAWAYLALVLRRGGEINSLISCWPPCAPMPLAFGFTPSGSPPASSRSMTAAPRPAKCMTTAATLSKPTSGSSSATISPPFPAPARWSGPVLAAQFGYLPGTLWILIGVVLGGAVQDFVILFCSLRRDGKSLGQMVKDELNSARRLVSRCWPFSRFWSFCWPCWRWSWSTRWPEVPGACSPSAPPFPSLC